MRKTVILGFVLCLMSQMLHAQNDVINAQLKDQLTLNSTDIIDALKMSGIEIHKFSVGEFDKKYKLTFFIDEYKSDSLVQERVLHKGNNTHTYFDEDENVQTEYISTIRIITEVHDEDCKLSISTEGITLNRQFSFDKTYKRQFFKWRPYANTIYQVNHKVPLVAYISSWKDARGYIRHCGAKELTENSVDTEKFFSRSPSYFIISYLIEDE